MERPDKNTNSNDHSNVNIKIQQREREPKEKRGEYVTDSRERDVLICVQGYTR